MNAVLNMEDTVKVGDKIRPIFIPAVTDSQADRPWYYQSTYTVKDVRHDYPYLLPDGTEGVGTVAFTDVNSEMNSELRKNYREFHLDSDRMYYVSHFEIVERAGEPDTAANPVIELTEHEKEIAALKENIRVQAERIEKLMGDVTHNSSVLTAAFKTQKDERGWCDEANRIVREVNEDLRGGLEITTEEEYDVEVEVTATFTTTITVTVMAASQDEANDLVMDDPEEHVEKYQISDALNWSDWDNIEYELAY